MSRKWTKFLGDKKKQVYWASTSTWLVPWLVIFVYNIVKKGVIYNDKE